METLRKGFMLQDKFEIFELKGRGSLNEIIYYGRHADLGRDIIIRILPGDVQMTDEIAKRFHQGIKLAARLQHPNILSVLDGGEYEGCGFVVTNYEKGYHLNEYLDHRGRLEELESARLIRSLADALDYAWTEQRIIHRDICPTTILIAKGNIPMLTDFGLAKSLANDTGLTLQGYAIGNPTYMSPEQAQGLELDFRSDIYCLGLVFYQMLAGHPPFRGENIMDVLNAQISERHKSIHASNENVSDACSAIIDKMLAKNVADRYKTWGELFTDLDALLNPLRHRSKKKRRTENELEKIRRESEKECRSEHARGMPQLKGALTIGARKKLKRNIIITAVIVNVLLAVGFLLYLKWK